MRVWGWVSVAGILTWNFLDFSVKGEYLLQKLTFV
jgi:hypothetical protein